MGIFSGEWVGVSQPPSRWHTGPGVRLVAGDRVWWLAGGWPRPIVRKASFQLLVGKDAVILIDERGRRVETCLARLFTSREQAEAEAAVLEEFAVRPTRPNPTRRRIA